MRKPKLVVRSGKGGFSPITSVGYVVQAILVLAFGILICWGSSVPWRPMSFFGLGIAGIVMGFTARDTVAWFLATTEERHEFVNYIRIMREAQRLEQQGRAQEPMTKLTKVLLAGFAGLALAIFVGSVLRRT